MLSITIRKRELASCGAGGGGVATAVGEDVGDGVGTGEAVGVTGRRSYTPPGSLANSRRSGAEWAAGGVNPASYTRYAAIEAEPANALSDSPSSKRCRSLRICTFFPGRDWDCRNCADPPAAWDHRVGARHYKPVLQCREGHFSPAGSDCPCDLKSPIV